MKIMLGIVAVTAFALCGTSLTAQTTANASGEFSLQGQLTSTGGTPIADGAHELTINVYAKGTSTVAYSEIDTVATMNGLFSTMVGDHGTGGAKLMVDGATRYELGVGVDGGAEMSPRIAIGSVLSAATADVAADAKAVGGFMVDTTGTAAHALVTTDANGRLQASLLGNSTVTSINGLHGNLQINVTGNGVSADTTGGVLNLNFTGSGGAGINFPFVSSALTVSTGDAFSVTNTLGGSAGAFVNTGSGVALRAHAGTGSAISATSDGILSGAATIDAHNMTGVAVSATSGSATDAALRVQNTAVVGTGKLISALDSGGSARFEVAANGRTTVNAAVNDALEVTTTSSGDDALKVNGGLMLNGPVGNGTIDLSTGQAVITNAYARTNSVIMLTITSATGVTTAVPLQVSSQGNGSFTVSAIAAGLGSLTGSYTFNYLIINR